METMATLGYGEFVPANNASRLLVMAELVTQILFVLAIIPLFVANLTTRLGGRQYGDLDEREE
jgi:hypothetical protein